jgi:zinc/manganese transport system substrate-binding protein
MIRAAAVAVSFLFAVLPATAQKLKVVATFSILGDIVSHVGGNAIELKTLVGPDSDAHVYEPTTADARAVANADIIIVNGRSFDDWAYRLAKAAGAHATIAVAAEDVAPLVTGVEDPHAWQNAENVITYVDNIERALSYADRPARAFFKTNALLYQRELQDLDAEIRDTLIKIPLPARRAVTTHGSFGYFAAAYGVSFKSPLGTSTEEQPSAKALAALITGVRRNRITALFLENAADPRLIAQVARETGVKLSGTLYADALSKSDGPAPTYIALMRHNLKLLTEAMAHGS